MLSQLLSRRKAYPACIALHIGCISFVLGGNRVVAYQTLKSYNKVWSGDTPSKFTVQRKLSIFKMLMNVMIRCCLCFEHKSKLQAFSSLLISFQIILKLPLKTQYVYFHQARSTTHLIRTTTIKH